MKATANVRKMKQTGAELYHISVSIARLVEQLQEQQSRLRQQSAFDDLIKPIGAAVEKLDGDRFHLYKLAQALDNIAETYRQTELDLEAELDSMGGFWNHLTFPAEAVDVTQLKQSIETLLYEGESHGND